MSAGPDQAAAGIVTRSVEEIARVLAVLAERREPLRSSLTGALAFVSRLRFVDPERRYILFEPSANPAADEALLARPRASFRALAGGVHVEFAAAEPQRVEHGGVPAIRVRFPEVMARVQRRTSERIDLHPEVPLRLVADAAGVISFECLVLDVSEAGIGFVQYSPNITLEPGTVLKGCLVELPGREPLVVDLEVRYSVPVALPGGRQALRSGCRFVDPAGQARILIASLLGR